jgi:hypothetical protein
MGARRTPFTVHRSPSPFGVRRSAFGVRRAQGAGRSQDVGNAERRLVCGAKLKTSPADHDVAA